MSFKGIDISSNNGGTIDFAKVYAAGIRAVYIKATEGISYTNPYFKKHAAAARAAGLKVGYYHFYQPAKDATAQAKYFLSVINGLASDMKPCLDFETAGSLTKATLSTAAKAFLDYVKSTGISPLIYSYTSFINSYLNSSVASYPVWVADYKNGSPSSNSVWGTSYAGWQYSSSGSVSGISGNVDLNTFTDSVLASTTTTTTITDTVFNAAIDELIKDKVLVSGDYWKNAIANGTACKGEYVASVMMKMTNTSTLAAAVQKLDSVGTFSTPSYWTSNAISGKTCNPTYVRAMIVNGVKLLKL
jgi:GH25 family lysozyme M1 (1,4-beta-N-acetylmuramidase)